MNKSIAPVILYLLSICCFQVNGQDEQFEDLMVLFADEKYEKCIAKAAKYSQKEKTKKHPLPFLYLSMSYYEMSRDHKYKEDYPKAYKSSLSYAAKYRKKDKGYAYEEDSFEYIETLKSVIIEEVENYCAEGTLKSNKKALGLMKKMIAIDPSDRGAALMRAMFEIRTNNKTQGKKLLATAKKDIESIGTDVMFDDMSPETQYMLRFALINYANFIKDKDIIEARKAISLGHQYFYAENEDYQKEYDIDFKETYDQIHK